MLILRLGCLSVACLCASVLTPALAQDNELQKVLVDGLRTSDAVLNLAHLQAESEGLNKVIMRLTEYQRVELAILEERSKTHFEKMPGLDLETAQTLIRNSRMELQKLTWDEAAESAMLEELEKDQQESKASRQSLMEADMHGRMEIAQRDLPLQLQRLAEMNGRNHSRSEISEQTAKIERAQIEIEVLEKQLRKVVEIHKAESELPATESKRRLAQIRVRRKLLENEIQELTKMLPQLREMASVQWQFDLERKSIESLRARITPLQLRQMEVEAVISVLEAKMKEKVEEAK